MTAARRLRWVVLLVLLLLLWVLGASSAGTRVRGCPAGRATAAERRNGPLRVMSLNMLHGFPRFERLDARLELIADEIRRQDADIVCLQEVPWTLRRGSAAQMLAERTGLNHLYLRANGNRWAILFEEGEAILSRYPLRDATFAELLPRAGFFEHRVVLGATAATPWGDIGVFVTHLTNGDPLINRGQAASLVRFVGESGDSPAVVAGDFNAQDDSPQVQAIASQWADTFRAANPADPGFTCCVDVLADDPSEPLEKRIDYLFLVPADRQTATVVRSQRVLDQLASTTDGWQWASDHVGLLAEIELSP